MRIYATIACIMAMLFSLSCQRSVVEPKQATLNIQGGIQDGILRLSGEASNTQLNINSNYTDWTAISLAPWLQVTQQGSSLTLTCEENLEAIERKTQVQIMAGGITQHIDVVQASGAPSLELGFSPRKVDALGGEVRVDVNSNTDAWSATTDATWIQIKRDLREGQLVLNIDKNIERHERTATVRVRTSLEGEAHQFEVTQRGVVYWLIPILGSNLTPEQVSESEQSRKHVLQGLPPLYSRERIFKYTTVSQAFPRIDYSFNHLGTHLFSKAILRNVAILAEPDLSEYKSFIESEGFSLLGQHVYWNDKQRVEAEILLNTAEPCVRFAHYPAQPSEITTGHPFPLASATIGTSTTDDVDAYQTSIGGVLGATATASRRVFTHTPGDGSKPFTYTYTFRGGVLYTLVYRNPNYSKYIYVGGNMVYPTADLRRILREEGFEYYSFEPYSLFKRVYRNPQTGVELTLELTSGQYAIQMTFKRYFVI